MQNENMYIGYGDKIRKYDKLEIESENLKNEVAMMGEEYKKSCNVIKFLETTSFIIDTNLITYAATVKEKYNKALNMINNVHREMHELNAYGLIAGNFRHVIFCLSKEIGKNLDELSIELKCINKDTINILCKDGSIDKESYIKLCKYFNLNEKSKRYIRYCR